MSLHPTTALGISVVSLVLSALLGCSAGGDAIGEADSSPTVQIDPFTFRTPSEILSICERDASERHPSLDCIGLLRATWCTPARNAASTGGFALSDEATGYAVNADGAGALVCVPTVTDERG